MNTERLHYLYQQYQLGQLTQAESQEWESAIADLSNDASLLSLVDKDWDLEDFKAPVLTDGEQETIFNYVVTQPQNRRKIRSMWPRIAAAASIILAVGAGIFFYANRSKTDAVQTAGNVNDVAPGKQGATLTLANGKKIRLSAAANGELAQEAGVTITKSANGQLVYEIKGNTTESNKINTLSTANGETYQLRLPDGSQVWLNSASSLTYTASLNERGKRVVRLSGEGYFEVAKDKAHPFVVQTTGQEVEVLGTHFNINSYADEPVVATTLLEGSVKVSGESKQQMLKPGQQALNNGTAIRVAKADLETAVDWKNNEFYLDKMDFRVAMRKIARWYDVEVIYSGSVPEHLEAGGWIPRSSNLSDVLKSIESSGLAHFKIEGRRLYVSK
ncbi:FecR domain-containing protein [Pedobacter panaciterrae]|uniref:FecR family protein n=1 Tax=Pedobacter panaciterrae TaxID=363849 RepID=UPI00155DD7C7|nr:FecR family protein [Pedobacter panaciterrae]NQX54434.1 FecR domain-containing protein [Pedobacter panaciterrae]